MVMNLLQASFEVSVNQLKIKKHLYLLQEQNSKQFTRTNETCDVVLTMLSNDAAVKEVF
jgi:3-hydroxyisobutyrate dehydrogenase